MAPLSTPLASLLAHQGGWDEMLMVVVPVGAFAGLLYVANRRASKLGGDRGRATGEAPGSSSTPPPAPRGPR
jgi:hypothetical protein